MSAAGIGSTARNESPERPRTGPRGNARAWLIAGSAAVLVAVMALDTTVVRHDAADQPDTGVFSPGAFGAAELPRIRAAVEARAVDATELAAAVAEDKQAAAERYGTAAGIGAVMPVRLSGTVGEGKAGVFDVVVDGLPEVPRVRVQLGPAVNGTDLRDATGDIAFGQFTNQIEYQNAGSAINDELKATVLDDIDKTELSGREIRVVGVFKLVNPKSWLVTPVDVKLP